MTKRREEEGIFFTPCLSGEGWWVIRSCFEGLWNVAKKNLFSDDVKKRTRLRRSEEGKEEEKPLLNEGFENKKEGR